MLGLLAHFCQKAVDSLTFDNRRNTIDSLQLESFPDVDGRSSSLDGRNSSLNEREPILQQPKITQQHYRRKRADSIESEGGITYERLSKKTYF